MLAALIFLLLTASEPAPAPAAETTAQPAPAAVTQAAADDKDRLVCRRETKPNTRFTSKTCKTVAEWEERSKTAQESFEDVRGRPMVKICSPTGGCD